MAKLPTDIIDLNKTSKALANFLDTTHDTAEFKRVGDFLNVYY